MDVVDDVPLLVTLADLLDATGYANQEWRARAACRGWDDVNFWYPERGDRVGEQGRVCRRCPVQVECLQFALDQPYWSDAGIWGGVSSKSRRRARRYGWTAAELLKHLNG